MGNSWKLLIVYTPLRIPNASPSKANGPLSAGAMELGGAFKHSRVLFIIYILYYVGAFKIPSVPFIIVGAPC